MEEEIPSYYLASSVASRLPAATRRRVRHSEEDIPEYYRQSPDEITSRMSDLTLVSGTHRTEADREIHRRERIESGDYYAVAERRQRSGHSSVRGTSDRRIHAVESGRQMKEATDYYSVGSRRLSAERPVAYGRSAEKPVAAESDEKRFEFERMHRSDASAKVRSSSRASLRRQLAAESRASHLRVPEDDDYYHRDAESDLKRDALYASGYSRHSERADDSRDYYEPRQRAEIRVVTSPRTHRWTQHPIGDYYASEKRAVEKRSADYSKADRRPLAAHRSAERSETRRFAEDSGSDDGMGLREIDKESESSARSAASGHRVGGGHRIAEDRSSALPVASAEAVAGMQSAHLRTKEKPRHWHSLRKRFPYNRWDTDPRTAHRRKHIVNAVQ